MKSLRTYGRLLLLLAVITVLGILVGFLYRNSMTTQVASPPANALYLDPAQPIEVRVNDLLSQMTLAEKIGQMSLVEKNSIATPDDIATYHLGALLSGGGTTPEENTPAGWRAMIAKYQEQARRTRLRIPLLYGVDAVHGHAQLPAATVFPHMIGLGASGNPELVAAVAGATAEELFAAGVNWSFSPNLDQPQDIRWGRVYEAFSDDSGLVSSLGAAYIKGLQSYRDDEEIFVLATPKHYIGLGGMEWNTSLNKDFQIDQGVTPANETLLRSRYLPPFAAAIDAGALSIMVGLNTWGDTRMVRQKELLTDVLKQELGFKGFVVSDWYGVHEGRKSTFLATVQAVNAGVDMVMLPFDYKEFARHLTWAHRLGLVSSERIDDAVGRILYAKFALGLFDEKREATPTIEIPNAEHQALARDAVAQSLVLLKNKNEVLPLSPNLSQLKVAGSAAHNVGKQMGGWTTEWQGRDGNERAEANSILEGIQSQVSTETKVEYDAQGDFSPSSKPAPVGIVVVGEKPYAEGWGDEAQPTLSEADLRAIENMQANSDQTVVVIVSGRPLLIANEIDSWDALVAAWLPGSEGAGVADVLFGRKPFVATLPLPWPRQTEQLPLTGEGETADGTEVLFPRYFGLPQ